MTASNKAVSQYNADRWKAEPFPYVPPFSLFHEHLTAEFTPLIELDSSNGLSPVYRDKIEVAGSGSITNSGGEHVVSTGSSPSSTATLSTQERGRYQPGVVGLPGCAVRRPTAPTGDQEIWWGYSDDIDGVRIGEDSTGVYVQMIQSGSAGSKIYQGDWNGDNLNGEGGANNWSGLTLDLTKMSIWRMPFTHYGAGPVDINLYMVDDAGSSVYVTVHTFGNPSGEAFWSNPKLPIRQYASNGTSSEDVQLYVGGRHFAVTGRYDPNRRQTAAFADQVTVPTTGLTPLVSFRKKDVRKFFTRSVKISGLSVLSDENLRVEILLGGSLTDPDWETPTRVPADETALEVDTSATAISGATRADCFLAQGSQGNRAALSGIRRLGFDIPDDTIITLVATAISAQATVSAAFTMEEEA